MRTMSLRGAKPVLAAAILALGALSPGFAPQAVLGLAPVAQGSAFAAEAAPEKMSLDLGGGASLRLSRAEPPRPEVFAGAPAYALWTREGFAEPVRFRLASNHAAYVRGWRLAIYRAGDLERRRPVWSASGRGVSYADAPVWNGSAAPGVPRLRPGEELFYVFEATDRLGRVAASDPAPLLVARYVMPQQARTLKPLAQATALAERPEMDEGRAWGLTIRVEGLKPGEALRLDGLLIAADSSGAAEIAQILPAGRYAPKVELTRPRGRTASGSLAFALGDPAEGVEPRPLWGSGGGAVGLTAAAPAPTRSAHYELANQTMIYLPDTDVARDSLRARIMVDGETAAALAAGEHYVLDALQGRLALTSAGRDLMDGVAQGLEEGEQKGLLEIAYRLIADLDGAGAEPAEPVTAAQGDGADFVFTYGDALGPEILIAAAETLIAETLAAEAEPPRIQVEAQDETHGESGAEPQAAPILLAEAAPQAAKPEVRLPAPRPDHPLDSPAPRPKPDPAASVEGPVLAAASPAFEDPALAALEGAATLRVPVRHRAQAAAALAAAAEPPKAPAPAAAEPSLAAQGLFIAASAPAGFEPVFWSESAALEAAARPAAPRRAAPEPTIAQMLTKGLILDKD